MRWSTAALAVELAACKARVRSWERTLTFVACFAVPATAGNERLLGFEELSQKTFLEPWEQLLWYLRPMLPRCAAWTGREDYLSFWPSPTIAASPYQWIDNSGYYKVVRIRKYVFFIFHLVFFLVCGLWTFRLLFFFSFLPCSLLILKVYLHVLSTFV